MSHVFSWRAFARRMLHGLTALAVLVGLSLPAVALFAQPASAAAGTTDDECHNGPISGPVPCQSGNWASGNATPSDSHWKEGQFISYRVSMTGLSGGSGATGTHNLIFTYDTVTMSKHAEDYLGNYDATETTGPATTENANRNNPCFDILGSGAGSGCTPLGTPPIPASTFPVPAANLAADKTCSGASGLSTTPTQQAGNFDIFAPSAASASITAASYTQQEVVSSGNTCTTFVKLTFDLPNATPGGWTVVLAFGGHIASALDWGVGNSASAVNGSPYHVALVSLDGTSTGAQDMQMKASAVAGPPTVTTQVSKTTITAGSTLTDTATLTGNSTNSQTPTGTVDFVLCSGVTTGCPQGFPGQTTIQSGVPLVNGVATTSPPFGASLAVGNYCIGLVYHNDGNSFFSSTYSGSATNECFTVTKAAPTISTQLSSSSVGVGGSVHDSAALSGETSNAGGTVDYRYYSVLSDCTADTGAFPGTAPSRGTDVGSQTVTNGSVPNSAAVTFNSAGTFYWAAFYSGDSINTGAASTCSSETLTVGKASPTITTALNANPIAIDTSTFDTATLHNASANAGGTVDYRFYTDQTACNADTAGTAGTDVGQVTVTNGVVPQSPAFTFHNAGTFPWRAFYSGDVNNAAAASDCSTELLVVSVASPSISTTLSAGTITVGGSVHDSATLTGASGNAGGSVDYRYYNSLNACTTDTGAFPGTAPSGGTNVGSVTVTNGSVPNSASVTFNTAGTFYWAAFYSGDTNNKAAVSGCSTETLVVGKTSPSIATQLSASTITAGGSVHDSATLTGATANASGTVDYRYYPTVAACQTDASAFPGTAPTGGTDVNTVTVTNGSVPASNSVTFNTAGTFYWAAFYSGDTNNKAAVSGCGTEPLTVTAPAPTGQITPTNTTCQQFLGGTASTLTQVNYQTRGTATIQGTQPGVFFYFVQVKAPASSFTVDVLQTIQTGETGPLFGIMSATAYNSSCTALKTVKGGTPGDDAITFTNATVGQTYVVGVKYSPKSIVGKPKPNPANITYTFSAKVNGTPVLGSPQSLNLVKTG